MQVLNADFTFSCTLGSLLSRLNYPLVIAFGRNGKVYVTDRDNHRVQVFTAECKTLTKFCKLNMPFGVAVDSDGIVNAGQ